jgi:hypothetical protein
VGGKWMIDITRYFENDDDSDYDAKKVLWY